MSASDDEGKVECQWCATTAANEATHCPKCGAALILRETIGDMVIPGVTHVDPALSQFANEPLHLPGPSPTQGAAGPAIAAAALGGPAGLVALAGLGGLAAAEYLGAGRGQKMTRTDMSRTPRTGADPASSAGAAATGVKPGRRTDCWTSSPHCYRGEDVGRAGSDGGDDAAASCAGPQPALTHCPLP
jgi:hypothetical protein